MKRAPVEPKVAAGSLGATAAGIIVWILQTYVFRGNLNAGAEAYIYAAIPGAVTFLLAYLAPHQRRPGDAAPAAPSNGTAVPPAAQPRPSSPTAGTPPPAAAATRPAGSAPSATGTGATAS